MTIANFNQNQKKIHLKSNNSYVIDKESKTLEINALDIKDCYVYDFSNTNKLLNFKGSHINYFLFSNKASKIKVELNNTNLNYRFIDLNSNSAKLSFDIILKDKNTNLDCKAFIFSAKSDHKEIEYNINHQKNHTFSDIDVYFISKDSGNTNIKTKSKILLESFESSAYQNSEGIIIGDKARASTLPILDIKDNRIKASHSSSIGKVSDEELFYLTSRGISEKEAIKLIIYGFFNYVLEYIEDKKIKEKIQNNFEEIF